MDEEKYYESKAMEMLEKRERELNRVKKRLAKLKKMVCLELTPELDAFSEMDIPVVPNAEMLAKGRDQLFLAILSKEKNR